MVTGADSQRAGLAKLGEVFCNDFVDGFESGHLLFLQTHQIQWQLKTLLANSDRQKTRSKPSAILNCLKSMQISLLIFADVNESGEKIRFLHKHHNPVK